MGHSLPPRRRARRRRVECSTVQCERLFSDRGLFDLRARDVYGRLVGRFLMKGRDVGAELVKGGAVFAWNGFLGRCDDLDYGALEAVAQRKRFGVWSLPGGVQRPWDAMEAAGGGEP